jgi:excisionase family DNA binding protein
MQTDQIPIAPPEGEDVLQSPTAVREIGMTTHLTTEHSPPGVLTVDQVAARFQLSTKTVYRALERRELRAAKFGSAWRIRQADADRWFEGSVPPTPPPRPDTRRRARLVSRPGSLRALEAT